MREAIPDNDVASLQEELAAAKLREAEANLALKDLKAKVADLSTMWKKHLQQRSEAEASGSTGSSAAVPSTPKKLLGSFLENGKSEVARLEEELMTARLVEVENEAELKASRLKVMELETQVCVVNSICLGILIGHFYLKLLISQKKRLEISEPMQWVFKIRVQIKPNQSLRKYQLSVSNNWLRLQIILIDPLHY